MLEDALSADYEKNHADQEPQECLVHGRVDDISGASSVVIQETLRTIAGRDHEVCITVNPPTVIRLKQQFI